MGELQQSRMRKAAKKRICDPVRATDTPGTQRTRPTQAPVDDHRNMQKRSIAKSSQDFG
jgi:hypothetical protein